MEKFMEFEWDENKNRKNKNKHGVRFEVASLVFHDPFLISVPDQDDQEGEERWRSIGVVDDVTLFIAHTWREDTNGKEIIRIISARAATPQEERQYYAYRENEKRS
jgi:uncharacterized protein